ncbi:carbohydrate sulfotransferase 11-like isoform X1 [Acanthaster planci]|uniref:Carbohydrate sulfotransferase n=1 Tax=Acanthaster planci TaxID=133434 RepID=A0A8B7ZD68_ACAPL|nr:carbohydrate sulfotransferase 11-like isoform X1 [Acanthaster planci]XP_022102795.1 carbohydrate sulfotransferase 11-like isoform X1 [Acanthaster planci]XP_022102796.1 carbohydrate sulfotransferase 11-like isoform X1 [Acanthaster planci]
MSTVAGVVLRQKCYCLCLAGWVVGFVVLCVFHLHVQDSNVETHRYKHTFDDEELLLMSLEATEGMTATIDHFNGTVYSGPSKQDANSNHSVPRRGEIEVPSSQANQQNTTLYRFKLWKEIQQRRVKTIRDVCLKQHGELSSNQGTLGKPHPQLSTNHTSTLTLRTLRHIFVSDKHRFMYCYIPKVGCSNWKRVMMFLKNNQLNIDDISSREAHSQNGLKTLRNFSPKERAWRLRTYKKFMFVRNPVSRIVSVYRNKFENLEVYRDAPLYGIRRYGKYIVKKYRRNATLSEVQTGENVTWSEWIAYLTNQAEESNFGDHWMQMSKICSPCDVSYDFIGKLETFSDDADYIMNVLNLTDVIVNFPGRENSHPTNSSIDVAKSYFEQVSKRKRRALWNIYKLDFQMLGYEKPDFLF